MKKGDKILIVLILIIGVSFLGYKHLTKETSTDMKIQIYIDSKLYKEEIITNKDKKIEIDNEYGHNIVHIHDGGVSMLESDCDNKVCLDTGFIEGKNEMIVCLPHKLFIQIVSNEDKKVEVDAVSN
ncbi:MAG: NusG domain II-containing protein [Peptostreptococcaceae bacterium]|jgi:hypothetical protein|nr:NusG domain II-containing protein [Peptostreptococcaceae bacterium]